MKLQTFKRAVKDSLTRDKLLIYLYLVYIYTRNPGNKKVGYGRLCRQSDIPLTYHEMKKIFRSIFKSQIIALDDYNIRKSEQV
jgi:hypothetical protein